MSKTNQKTLVQSLIVRILVIVLSSGVWAVSSYSHSPALVPLPRQINLSTSSSQTQAAETNGKIAFTRNDSGIHVMNADGSSQIKLTNGSDAFPTWSPDGTRIAFTRRQTSDSGIYVMNADGSSQIKLTNGSDAFPAWSPDGTRIAFTRWQTSDSAIYVINADGSDQTILTDESGINSYEPVWSPTGTKIAYTRVVANQDGYLSPFQYDTYVIDADGKNRTRLTDFTYGSTEPVWSPDGNKIAFVSLELAWELNAGSIYVMNSDGTNPISISEESLSGCSSPTWSPDGTKIAFAGFAKGRPGSEIFVTNSDGGNRIRLTNNMVTDLLPQWSPDGTRIAFVSDRDNVTSQGDVYLMNADGSSQTRLTTGLQVWSISWSLQTTVNPLDDAQRFVDQHYLDFLHRQPDASGLAYWTHEITQCGGDSQCIEANRVNVSAAFFMSIEFQQTGYLVYRMYKAAYGDISGAPVPLTRQEFLPDSQRVGSGVVVNAAGWEQQLENNKNKFADDFVGRARFTSAFPAAMTPQQFVDTLNSNAGGALTQGERDQLVNDLGSGVKTRAQVLRAVAEDADLARNEFNKAFVLMQYFGYLGRNPNDAPDVDFSGYNFWLNKLNSFGGNFVNAEMVKAFIDSSEYRGRLQACAGCWDY
jgi:Tol biopolymer transport system component